MVVALRLLCVVGVYVDGAVVCSSVIFVVVLLMFGWVVVADGDDGVALVYAILADYRT